jgi:hemolysin III
MILGRINVFPIWRQGRIIKEESVVKNFGQERVEMEERLNAITHGVGTAMAVGGLVVLVVAAQLYGSIWHTVSFSIYGVSLVLLYLASTLYHSFTDAKLKYIFKIIDHAAIYLFIAGTYTPFTLVVLHGTLGWTVFGVIWGLALIGVFYKIFFAGRFKILSTICYIIMGWLMIFCIKPLIHILPTMGVGWLLAGGLLYTLGAGVYLWRRLPYNHAVWHMFVLSGSICHFIAVFYYILPIPINS